MKRKYKVMCHQVEQLSEEIREKDNILKKDTLEHERKVKHTEQCKESVSKARRKTRCKNEQKKKTEKLGNLSRKFQTLNLRGSLRGLHT